MNILYVSTSYPPAIGGAQIHLHYLAKAIKELGNDVNVLTTWSTNRNDYLLGTTVFADKELNYQYEGVQIFQIGFSKLQKLSLLPWVLSYYFLMETAIHKISSYYSPYFESLRHRPSLVHASRIGREFNIQAALDYCQKYDIPFILTPNHHERWQGYLYRQYDKIYRAADAIIVLTEAEKDILIEQKGVKEERIFQTGIGPVLSERYSEEEFRTKYNVKGRYILFLGQHFKYKGFASLIKAAPMVWKRDRDVKFVFIGPQTSYSRKIFRNVTDPRIISLGPVDMETKTAALAGCEFLCVPSLQESFGGVYLEAWSLDKAVIGGKNPAVACVIEHAKDGFLSSQNPSELSELLGYLLSHPKECADMGHKGWQKVQEKYTWEQIAKKTAVIYKGLY